MKRFLVVLLAVVVIFTSVIPKQEAKADGLTIAAISSCAYAIASASGMDFSFTGYDGLGVGQWMQNRINSWLAGRTVAEAFGSEVIRLTAGKLLVPSAAVAGIVSFLSDLKTKTGLSENMSTPKALGAIYEGSYINPHVYYNANQSGKTKPNVIMMEVNSAPVPGKVSLVEEMVNGTRCICAYDSTGVRRGYTDLSEPTYEGFGFLMYSTANGRTNVNFYIGKDRHNDWTNPVSWSAPWNFNITDTNQRQTAIIPGAYSPPQGLNDLQSWEGTVANAPDTNLDQHIDDIFDQSAAGTLDVSGQVVDTPAEPEVTPVPTAAPGDIVGGLDTISGQLEGIDNTLTGVQEGVGEAVGQLEGINEGVGSIAEALETPTSSEASSFKYDLTTLFPFCIPFDIYRFVTMFNASPVAPHVQIPFNIPAIGLQYTFDLDFSSFNSVASVLRSVELIAFCVGLAILTSKVIRW